MILFYHIIYYLQILIAHLNMLWYNFMKVRLCFINNGGTMKPTYKTTMTSCFIGYIVQAIVNNFIPLLFVTLQIQYSISLGRITMLVTINFAVQLTVDFLATYFVDRIGYRISIVAAHVFSAAGLILLSVLPDITPDPFSGILAAVILYAIVGGLIEVLISPIMESCPPTTRKRR